MWVKHTRQTLIKTVLFCWESNKAWFLTSEELNWTLPWPLHFKLSYFVKISQANIVLFPNVDSRTVKSSLAMAVCCDLNMKCAVSLLFANHFQFSKTLKTRLVCHFRKNIFKNEDKFITWNAKSQKYIWCF